MRYIKYWQRGRAFSKCPLKQKLEDIHFLKTSTKLILLNETHLFLVKTHLMRHLFNGIDLQKPYISIFCCQTLDVTFALLEFFPASYVCAPVSLAHSLTPICVPWGVLIQHVCYILHVEYIYFTWQPLNCK